MNKPLMYAPISGCAVGLNAAFKTSKFHIQRSMAILSLRAKFCSTPVKKACWKKYAENQKIYGMPFETQFFMNFIRRR